MEEAKRSNLRHRPIGLGAQKNGAAIMIDDVLDGDGLMAMDFLESIQYIESSIHSSNIYIYTGWWFGTMLFYDFPIILGME